MGVAIRYGLEPAGWAKLELTVGDTTVAVGEFGYCTDALGDLVRAALPIATGASRAEVSFDGEPQE